MSKKTGFLSVTLVAGLATGLLAPHYTGLTVNAAPSLNPYGTVQAEIDFERDIKEVYTEGDIQGVSLESGNYFQMRTVNFSQGVSRIGVTVKADTMGKLEIHKGGKDGEVVGSIKINNTNGEYKNFSSPVTGLEGTETITFVQSVGSSMVDSWNAEPGAVTEQPGVTVEQPAVDDSESRYDKVEAEACTKSDKAMTTPNKKAVMITEGEYILAKDADFSEGLAGFYVNAGSSAAQSSMAIYIDEIKGDALATIAVTNKDTAELSAKFASDIKGKHDVYFVAKKGMVTIDSLQAIKATGEVASEEPVVEEPTSEEPVVEEPVVEQPVTGDTVNAYDMVQAEASSEFKNAMISPKKDEVAMLPGGYIAIENVDFSRKTDGIFVYTRAEKQPGLKLNVYLDDMNGKPIATITAHGMNAIKESGARITTDITGTHKVYIVSDSENAKNITIDSWKLSEKKTGEPTSEEPVVEQPVEEPTSEEPVVEQPVSGDTVNPYDKVEAEKCTKIENGMKTPSKNAVLVRKDGYIYVENVDFSKGIDGIFVNVESSTKSTIDVYLDKMSGNALAQIVVTPDKKTNGVKLSSDVKGTHSVYFVVKGDSVTIDSWYALQGHKTEEPVVEQPVEEPTSEEPVVEQPVSGDTVNPYGTIQAESTSDYENARISPKKNEVAMVPGGYIAIENVNFSKGADGIFLFGRGTAPSSKVKVYLDDMKGEPIATFNVKSNPNDLAQNVESAGRLSSNVTGVHKVYFVADGTNITIDYLRFSYKGQGNEPVVEEPTSETPVSSDKVNPYTTVEAESSAVLKDADRTSDKKAVKINIDGYIVAKNVDFSKGIAGIGVNVQSGAPKATIEVYVDKVSGSPIATLGRFTMAAAEYKTEFASDIKGTHDVYFVVKGNPVTVDSWYAMAAGSAAEEPTSEEPVVAKKVNPYTTVEAEASAEFKNADKSSDKKTVNVAKDGYILIKNADFSKGLGGFGIIASSSAPNTGVNIYIDKMGGTPVANIKIPSIGDCKLVTTTFASDIKGKHDVYLASDGKTFTIDSWYAVQAKEEPTSEEPVSSDKVNPYTTVEAESSAVLKDAKKTSDKKAVKINIDGYMVAKNVDFSKGISGIGVNVQAGAPKATIEVYVDKVSGSPIATLGKFTMAAAEYKTEISSNIKGTHDVYFVVKGNPVTVDSWYAMAAGSVVEQPTSEEPTSEQPTSEQPTSEQPVVQPSKTGMKLTHSTNAWPGGYLTNFTVQNASGKSVDTWKLKIKKNGIKITQSWCVNLETVGDYYVVTPLSWNSSLTNGQSIQFGIIADGEAPSTIDYVFE